MQQQQNLPLTEPDSREFEFSIEHPNNGKKARTLDQVKPKAK